MQDAPLPPRGEAIYAVLTVLFVIALIAAMVGWVGYGIAFAFDLLLADSASDGRWYAHGRVIVIAAIATGAAVVLGLVLAVFDRLLDH